MAKRLRFSFSPEKFVNAVAYLAQACPQSTKMTICKHLYFADKEHLVRYGRPITGDQYYKLDHGPIPSVGLNMLRQKASPSQNALLEKHVSVVGKRVHPKMPASRKVFSKSDIEVLDWVVKRYGKVSAAKLRALTHTDAAWKEAGERCQMDYALFFEENLPEAAAVKELTEEEQHSRDLLSPYAAR
jgi:uncharacterized phage-associated protein